MPEEITKFKISDGPPLMDLMFSLFYGREEKTRHVVIFHTIHEYYGLPANLQIVIDTISRKDPGGTQWDFGGHGFCYMRDSGVKKINVTGSFSTETQKGSIEATGFGKQD